MASQMNEGLEGRVERPRARAAGLVVREVADEVLVYDLESHRAVCLNRTAALIWRECDGRKTVQGIARGLKEATGEAVHEEVVWLALEQLGRDRLLEARVATLPATPDGLTRRQMIRSLGLAAAIALPVVTSIVAPTPAQAASCFPTGATCSVPAECCNGVCSGGTCA
jgi:hypothetical protein